MAEPTLTDIFGTGATQDLSTITIQKSALAAKGLTPSANNNAESLLVALLLIMKDALTETARATDIDNRQVTIFYQGQDLINQAAKDFRRDSFSIMLYKQTALAAIDPSDY